MANTIGKFYYEISGSEKDDEILIGPIVHITLKTYSQNANGWPVLSNNLMSEGEIDWHIQAYKDDLDHVGRLAKRALRRRRNKIREWLAERRDKNVAPTLGDDG